MTEFQTELRDRAREALRSLAEAREAGDDYSADVHTGDLESIQRLADDNGVRLPELERFGSDAA